MPNLDSAILQTLTNQWDPSDPWLVVRDRGFTRWPTSLAQHFSVEPTRTVNDIPCCVVTMATDVLDGVALSDDSAYKIGLIAGYATTSGLCRQQGMPSRLQLMATAIVNERDFNASLSFVALNLLLQANEAQTLAPVLAQLTGGTVASTPHPQLGVRGDLDPLVAGLAAALASEAAGAAALPALLTNRRGRAISPWAGAEMKALKKSLGRRPCVLATGDSNGVAAEFPFAGKTSLLEIQAGARHPRLGDGCLFTLKLPVGALDATTAKRALELNELEAALRPPVGWSVGSWCVHQNGLAHTTFLPNILCDPGVLTTFGESALARIRWVTESVFQFDIDAHYDSALRGKQKDVMRVHSPKARSKGKLGASDGMRSHNG